LFGLDLLNPKHRIEFDYYENFFNEIDIIFLSRKASQKSSEISWYLRKKGIIIDDFDVRHPIPKAAIDQSKKTLKQNPGY
jgi:hypothetical protein